MKLFLYYILATICFSQMCFANPAKVSVVPTTRDAHWAAKKVDAALCGGKKFPVYIEKDDGPELKKLAVLYAAKDLVAQENPSYAELLENIHINLDYVNDFLSSGASRGRIQYTNNDKKQLLLHLFYLPCTPMDKYAEYKIIGAPAEPKAPPPFSSDDSVCQPGTVPRNGVLLPDGIHLMEMIGAYSLVHSANQCVPCGRKDLEQDTNYPIADTINGNCIDENTCPTGYEKIEAIVTKDQREQIDSMPLYEGARYKQFEFDYIKDNFLPKGPFERITVCAQKCGEDSSRVRPYGYCRFDPKKTCAISKRRLKKLENLDLKYLLNIKNYAFCTPQEVYEGALEYKQNIIQDAKGGLAHCGDVEQSVLSKHFILLTVSRPDGVACGVSLDGTWENPPETSVEDAWTVEHSVNLDEQ